MTETESKLQTALRQENINQETYHNITSWLQNTSLSDFHAKIENLTLRQEWKELNDAFYTAIQFGTAGIRGKTGLGSARINRHTVGVAVQGLADYIVSTGKEALDKGVVIGSDTRLTSPEFIKLTSNILTSNGLKVYQFKRPPQVGMLSYAVRLKQAQAGIYISASHNPPSDNGLKIYWSDGAQVLPPHDEAITEAVTKVKSVKLTPEAGAKKGTIEDIEDDFDDAYRLRVLHESVYSGRSARVVYSPFHGTGQYGVLPILRDAGFSVETVLEQMAPDGAFPNVPGGTPNPQNKEANALTAAKVEVIGADIGISTDPDADRLGLVVPMPEAKNLQGNLPENSAPKNGEKTVILDGNQTSAILAYFICDQLKKDGKLPQNGFLARTVVSTALMDAIAKDFNLKIYADLPVGFKYIGQCIKEHEDEGDELFIFAGEESYGCLKGSYARDKDASVASLIACEMISYLKDNNLTVWDLLAQMEERYGIYRNVLVDIKYEGAEGFAVMGKIMEGLRQKGPQDIGRWPVISIIDRKTNEVKKGGQIVKQADGHKTDLLIFNLRPDGKTAVMIRPSGTEAKIKLYISYFLAKGGDKQTAAKELLELVASAKSLL